jgi:hypothetical protein
MGTNPITVFETAPFNHCGTSPGKKENALPQEAMLSP